MYEEFFVLILQAKYLKPYFNVDEIMRQWSLFYALKNSRFLDFIMKVFIILPQWKKIKIMEGNFLLQFKTEAFIKRPIAFNRRKTMSGIIKVSQSRK